MTHDPPRWLRVGLWPVSLLYGGVVALRNAMFDTGLRPIARLGVPVISVGNVTVGGTGKTPLVMWLVERARRAGRTPGVLARGYGRPDGAALNEEGEMLAARFPGLLQVQEPDRVRGGAELVAAGVDLVILDDGFQHRRVHRDHNLLCVDARMAAADTVLLPAGRLREPISAMRRADAVILTRADALSFDELEQRRRTVQRIARREIPVLAAAHRPRDIVAMPSGEVLGVERLRGQRVGLMSAVARPDAFEETAQRLGAEVAWHQRWRDHHRFTRAEVEQAAAKAESGGVQLVVTEKDEPKLGDGAPAHWVLRVDLHFTDGEPAPELLGLD